MTNEHDMDGIIQEALNWSQEVTRERCLSLLNKPTLFDIELSSRCNVRCSFCPSKEETDNGFMNEQVIDQIVSWLPENAVVMLSGLGEPTLNPLLSKFVERLASMGISSCIVTNGMALVPKLQHKLFDAGLSQIQVSVHAVSEDLLSEVMVGSKLTVIQDNLRYLSEHRPQELKVQLNFVETPDNTDERGKVEALANGLGFDFYPRRLHSRGGKVLNTNRKEFTNEHFPGCGILANVTYIDHNGNILPCVNVANDSLSFGNIFDRTFADIKRSKKAMFEGGTLYPECNACNDDYRYFILFQLGLD